MFDLIIIGAGPAGSACARKAGQLGLSTLIIEKEDFPRDKACGGAFSERAISYLDFDIPDNLYATEIFGARVHFKGKTREEQKKYRIGILINRNILDDFLLQKAREVRIETKMGEAVVALNEKEGLVEVLTSKNSYQARYVVIAEGAQGSLKKLIRPKIGKDEMGVCLVTEVQATSAAIDSYTYNLIDIHFGVVEGGYGWIFPHDGYYSVGVGGFITSFKHPRFKMLRFLEYNGFKGQYKLKGHLIPAGGKKRNLCSRRIVLCGDAAGFVDSFTGEGISYAIRSGQIAAEVIKEVLNSKQMQLTDYTQRCQKEFGINLRYSLFFTKLMHRFPGLFFKLLTSNDDVLSKFLEVAAMQLSYQQYLRWLLPRVFSYVFKK